VLLPREEPNSVDRRYNYQQRRMGGPPEPVLVNRSDKADGNTGLLADLGVMTDNLATLLENEVDRSIGRWPTMSLVDDVTGRHALRHTLGL
jgi:hypothetical protein